MNKYRELFDSLDTENPKYIDGFIFLINKILIERDYFVKSTGDDKKREEFYSLLKSQLNKLRNDNEKIEFIAAGHSSLAFKINDKVVRIGKSKIDEKNNRKQFKCIIPLFLDETYKIGEREYYNLQITPYVDTNDISNEELYDAYYELRKEGYIWNDPKTDNVGRIIEDIDYNGLHYKKGDLVIIDLEDIAYVGEITPDIVLDEICYSSYNCNVYKFETRYMKTKTKRQL